MPGGPNVTDLERLYANRFSARERAEKRELWKTLCDHFLRRYISPDASVLDLGAGHCDFINNITAARKIALDLNPETAASADPGVEVHRLPFERLGEVVPPGSLDVAFASNVFEHLRGPDVLLEILGAVHRALRPGGLILILQPNVRHVGAAFWDFVDHTLPLTEKGMIEALEVSGFAVIECRSRFLPYTTKGRLPRATFLLRIFLAARSLQWFFGKQMFLVGRRVG